MSRTIIPESEQRFGYFTDLSTTSLAEGSDTQWMQLFPYGSWNHPLYGKITMNAAVAQRMSNNLNESIREIEIAIDYSHNAFDKAAGWIKRAEVRDDGLWGLIEWTPEAATALRAGEYKYFSPEFAKEWTHPKTGVKYQDVLIGGGLTNRPFLKEILPVNLSEVLGGEWHTNDNGDVVFKDQIVYSNGGSMDEVLKKLVEALGIELAEDADEEATLLAFTEAFEAAKKPDEKPDVKPDIDATKLSEAVKALVDEHPEFSALSTALAAQDTRVAAQALEITALTLSNRLTEVSAKMTEWHRGGTEGKRGMPVALDDDIKKFLLSASADQVNLFGEIITELQKTGFVILSEAPRVPPRTPTDDKEVAEEVQTRANALMKEATERGETLAEHEALSQVFDADEDLYAQYRDSTYIVAPGGES